MTHAAEIGRAPPKGDGRRGGEDGRAGHTTLTTKCQFISHETRANASGSWHTSWLAEVFL